MAAVLYVFRTLVDDDIPLNAGCLKPLEVDHPRGLDAATRATRPRWSPATSRPRSASPTRCTARSACMARGQGTMNNFTFGNDALPVLRDHLRRLAAPGPDFDGTDVVQTHMTNSRLTDPEVLEWRFPVLLESFAIRARLAAARAAGAAATAPCAACASSSR